VVERRLQQASSREDHATSNELAACIINSFQGSLWVGRVGIVIAGFHHTCKKGPDWGAACAASTLGLIASLGNVASYFAAVASQCAEGSNHRALCAADISQITAATAALGNAGANVKETCSSHNLNEHWKVTQLAAESEQSEHRSNMDRIINNELDKLGKHSNVVPTHTEEQKKALAMQKHEEPKFRPLRGMQATSQQLGAQLQGLSGKNVVV